MYDSRETRPPLEEGLHVCGCCSRACSPQGRCQDFDEYFSINRLPLSALAFVLRANPSEREEIPGRHLPQVIIEVPVTWWPLTAHIYSAEEAVSRLRKQESAIKRCSGNNKSNVADGSRGSHDSPQRLANRANVTQPALFRDNPVSCYEP